METPGQILKRERETSGTTLKEIASITRIPVSALKNLEEDRYDLFPAEVFAKGFLRNYCRELHVDVDEVMLAYNTLKQQQRRQEPSEPSRNSSPSLPAATVESSAPRARKRVDPVTPLILSAPDGEAAAGSRANVDSSQRTFRFAYLIVFLVVATSLGLSVLFTGTGEAEENEKRRVRPVVEGDADKGSRWLTDDEPTLSAEPADNDAVAPLEDPPAVEREEGADSVDSWSRPAFPEDDQAQ